jgi:hypothetical protein
MKNILALFICLILLATTFISSYGEALKINDEIIQNKDLKSRTTDWEFFETLTTEVQIDAGENYYIKFDNDTLKLEEMPPKDLPDECYQALGIVPDWLKDNLTYKFRQLSNSNRITYANLIINSPEPKYIDEIAFCIAHTSVEALQHQYMFPQLFTDNAKYIYQNDQYLSYVDIVEKTDYTTISYKNKTNVSQELPGGLVIKIKPM